jgi:hypothetical protein
VGGLRRGLEEICDDEQHHLDFHGEFFARQGWGVPMRAVWQAAWWSLALAAMSVVLVDHRRTLRTMGIPLTEAVRAFLGLVRVAASHLPVFPARGEHSRGSERPVTLGER